MKICKDGRIYGQNNKEAGNHLGILTGCKYVKKGYNPNSAHKGYHLNVGKDNAMYGVHRFGKDSPAYGIHRFGKDNPFYGKCHSKEAKEKMKDGHLDTHHTIEVRKKMSEMRIGENNNNWQGGITPLNMSIRKLFKYKEWRHKIFVRDNFTCVKCYKTGGKLHAHHTPKAFAEIFVEFLQEYDQFSPYDDKDTLVRLAMKYKPFWDIDNGETQCKDCHEMTFGYYNRKKGG